jgi:hypothetical protein
MTEEKASPIGQWEDESRANAAIAFVAGRSRVDIGKVRELLDLTRDEWARVTLAIVEGVEEGHYFMEPKVLDRWLSRALEEESG